MKKIVCGAVLAGLVFSAGIVFCQTDAASPSKTALLEQEYALAKTPSTYFVFDFGAGAVRLKSKGIVLKEWPIAGIRIRGRGIGVMTYPLVKKTAYRAPQRKDITPGKAEPEKKPEPKSDDLDIMELSKMPVSYTLELPEDVRIIVRLRKSGFGRIAGDVGKFFSRGIGRSVKTIFRALKKRPFTDIELDFAEAIAAKNIYWAFFEGQKCILYQPE